MQKTYVGTIAHLYVYPVKSMQGIAAEEAELFWYGFRGDRKCAFVRSENGSNFPWLTGRQTANLVRYQPYFVEPADPFASAIRVKTPDENDYALEDQALQTELSHNYKHPVHLMKLNRGTFDCMPISIMSLNTIQNLNGLVDASLESRRFRPNIVIDTASSVAQYPEDDWLGQGMIFGDEPKTPHLQINYRIKRCAMINIDPDSAEVSPPVLRAVAQTRESCAGVYAAVSRLDSIRVGDPVYVIEEGK
ncbi:MAG: MOSC N-terminal beta barrel domain-containing protein [Chloroflexota bacterium]